MVLSHIILHVDGLKFPAFLHIIFVTIVLQDLMSAQLNLLYKFQASLKQSVQT